jgi:stage IV sporulation protein B
VIPLKTITVEPAKEQEVYVSGDTIGVYLKTDGVLVVDTGEIVSESGTAEEPAKNIVKAGDYIVSFNQQAVTSKKELIRDLESLDGGDVTLEVRREEETIPVSLTPVKDSSGEYKLGIWVRDDTQGIGTLTFVDENGRFGALGHGISDVDTGELLTVKDGSLYQAQVLGIVKGSRGNPGELSGLIRYDSAHLLGNIAKNTNIGIFGTIDEEGAAALSLQKLPVAYKQELTLGEASILACIDGNVQEFTAEITRIDLNHEDTNKSFVIKVTDERLIEATGGIVQGMSGSPILQNGKLVGAITHVFVQDATTGYGIFAENMLAA